MAISIAPALMTLLLQAGLPGTEAPNRIEFDQLAVLTSQAGAPCMVPHESTYGAVDARGRYVLFGEGSDRLQVFSPQGDCVGEVGRPGSGPGEYGDIAAVEVEADSLYVYDLGNYRVSVLGPDLEVRRSFRPEMPVLGMRVQVASTGMVVANLRYRRPEAADYSLHRFAPDGRYVGSFSARDPDHSRAFHAGDQVWEADPRMWTFRLLSLDGEHLRTLSPEPPSWFPEADEEFDYSLRTPPLPSIGGMWPDEHNRLWVMIRLPGSDWESGIREEPDGRRRIADRTLVYATAIYALDATTGAVLGSGRIEGFATRVDGGLLGLVRYDDRPDLTYTILRPRLVDGSLGAR
ncbi:MAG: hypothetical protein WEA24_11705 [Gemmatimonadota bacterium]